MNKRVINAAVIYVAVLMGIVAMKPSFFVDPTTGRLKCFGLESNETLFPAPLVALVIALISYLAMMFQKE